MHLHMNWEKVGKAGYQLALSIIEWGLKICAFVAGLVALGAKGSFGAKLGTGFSSLSYALRQLFEMPATFNKISWAAREYHQLGSAEFREAYGLAPIDQLVTSLNGFFTFSHQISSNLSNSPFISIVAGILVFSSFYLLSRIIRFARQKGRGSLLCRLEKRLGDRIFDRVPPEASRKVSNASKRNSVNNGVRKGSPKLT